VVPNRFRSLAGAGQAAAESGKKKSAEAYYRQLLSMVADGETERSALHTARSFMQQNGR
jgi:hypothetical protein